MKRFTVQIETEGNNDTVNLHNEVANHVRDIQGIGVVSLFVVGSTAALTTLEYETGLVKHDLPRILQAYTEGTRTHPAVIIFALVPRSQDRVTNVIGPLFGLVLRYVLTDFKVPMLIWRNGLH